MDSQRRSLLAGISAVPFALLGEGGMDSESYCSVDLDVYGERVGLMAVQSARGAPADSLIYRLMEDYFTLQRFTIRKAFGKPERLTALSIMGWCAVLLANQYTKKADLVQARAWVQRAYSDGNMIRDPELLGQASYIAATVEFHYGNPELGVRHGRYGLYLTRNQKNPLVRAMGYAGFMINTAKVGDYPSMREAERDLLGLQQTMDEPKQITTFTLSPSQFYNALGLAHEVAKSPNAALYFTNGEENMKPRGPNDTNGESFRWIFHFATTRSIAHVQPSLALAETEDTLKKISGRSNGHIDGLYRDRARKVIAALPEGFQDINRTRSIRALIEASSHINVISNGS